MRLTHPHEKLTASQVQTCPMLKVALLSHIRMILVESGEITIPGFSCETVNVESFI